MCVCVLFIAPLSYTLPLRFYFHARFHFGLALRGARCAIEAASQRGESCVQATPILRSAYLMQRATCAEEPGRAHKRTEYGVSLRSEEGQIDH